MELFALYFSLNMIWVSKSRSLRWAEYVARVAQSGGAYRISLGKHEGSRPLGTPRSRWEDNIKMDLRDVGWEVLTGSISLRIGTGGELL
jgi:hypothetical protein